MASIIRVKRSTGVTAPSSLSFGELALTTGTGTQANKGDRLFVGYNGDVQEIGGKYYTDLLDHAHGVLTASSAVILDSDSKINQWNVDNLRLDGNTFSSTNTDGHITITPNGTGRVQFLDDKELQFGTSDDIRLSYDSSKDALFFERGSATGGSPDIRIADDIQFQFGSNNSARIYYDAAGLTNSVQVEGVDWNFANGVAITISDTTQSTDKDTGALVVEGGVGIEKNLNVGGKFNLGGSATLSSDLSVSGVSTFTGSIDANGDLDVDGHTELDNVNVSGVSTFVGIATFNDSVFIANQLFVSGISVGGATFGEDITTRNLSASGIITATGVIDANGGAEVKNINIGVTGPNEIDTSTGNLTIDSAGGTVTIDDNLVVTGFATVTGTVRGNNFISTSTTLQPPTIGDYSGERLRLFDFNDPTNTNYAIGVEGSHIWFGVDTNNDAQGFKWYGEETEVMRLGGTGNLTIGGDLRLDGGDIKAFDGTTAISISTVTGNVKSGGDLIAGSGFFASAIGTRGLFINDNSGDVSFQGKAIVNEIRSQQNSNTLITLSGLDASFANHVNIAGITTIRNIRIGFSGANEIDTVTGNLTIDSAGGTVTIDDQLVVSGISTFNNKVDIDDDLNVDGNVTIIGVSTFTGAIDANGGATIDNIQIGISNNNEIDTVAGNLTLDSAGGTVAIDDQLVVSGISTFNSSVVFDSTGSIQIPVGDVSQRPGVAVTGQIRYNSEYSTFEGFGPGGNWGSLGGVKDVDGNTYIIPESAPGANENILFFVNDGTTTATLSGIGLTVNVDLKVAGVSTFTGVIDANGGAEIKNVNIGVTGPNEIDTSTGNLTIDSAGGLVTVDDKLVVTGISTFNSDTTFNGSVDIDVALNVDGNVSITGLSTFTGAIDANGGATIDNIQIGITNDNEIDTTTGNLTIDSAGGTVTVDDQLVVTGISTFNASVKVDNNLDIDGNLTVDGDITLGDASTDVITVNARFNTDLLPSSDDARDLGSSSREWRNLFVDGLAELDDVNVSSAATISTLSVTNNITIGGDQTLTGDLTVQGSTTLGNQSTDSVVITGIVTHIGTLTNIGGAVIDSIGISSNVISTKSGSGNTLFIDPYPDGLSNEGTVVIKGDLQVDGTTTTVNSVNVTTNNPIYVLGDNVTNRTVVVASGIGTDLLNLDSVAGINTNDVVTGTNIPSNTVINGIDSGNKVITLSNTIIGSIDAGTQITISQGLDTNDDRGIAFKYVSSGIGTEVEIKTGFFGFDDSNSRWTYIPDATITNNVVSGTKGYLDIKGIFYQSGDFSANGISYFNGSGQLTSTVAPGSGISTSNFILTTDASGVPTWTDTIDGGLF